VVGVKTREADVPSEKEPDVLASASDGDQAGNEAQQELQAEYVGYGHPPKHAQFKPGVSGNPQGRPKGSKDLASIFGDVFDQKITVTRNGKSSEVLPMKVLAHKLVAQALSGDRHAMKMMLALYDKVFPASNDNEALATGSSFDLSPEHSAAIEKFILLKGVK
jgi:hypothetical protein